MWVDNMKRILILISFISAVLFSQISFGNDIKGNFSCKVKSTPLIEMHDGFPKSFSGYKNDIKTGDELTLKYDYLSLKNSITFHMKYPQKNYDFYSSGIFGKNKWNNEREIYNVDGKIYISNNLIILEGIIGKINLERYYKNDWHGFILESSPVYVHIITLNCTHYVDKFDSIFSILKQKGFK